MEFKKFGKIFAAISMATVMSVSALSASAATVVDTDDNITADATYSDANKTIPLTGGGFYAYYNSTGTWNYAPHGMFDRNIAGGYVEVDGEDVWYDHLVVDNGDNTVTFGLQLADYTVTYGSFSTTISNGYIYEILDANGNNVVYGIDEANGVIPSTATLTKGVEYTLYAKTLNDTTTLADDSTVHNGLKVKFVII